MEKIKPFVKREFDMPHKIKTKKEIKNLINCFCRDFRGISPVFIGISGPVGSGKSFISSFIKREVAKKMGKELTYIPFDYWINYKDRQAPIYAGRFLLNDFFYALEKIRQGKSWFKPRYDLVSIIEKHKRKIVLGERSDWKETRKIKNPEDVFPKGGKMKAYLEPDSLQAYTAENPFKGICLLDGTMIFTPDEIKKEYALRIYVTAPWAIRLARMAGRYRRNEVFTKEFDSGKDYVSFLAKEAKSCADGEIEGQLDETTYVIENCGDSLSDLSDLCFLKNQLINNPELKEKYSVSVKEVEKAIESVYDYFSENPDKEDVLKLKKDLSGEMSQLTERLKSIIKKFH